MVEATKMIKVYWNDMSDDTHQQIQNFRCQKVFIPFKEIGRRGWEDPDVGLKDVGTGQAHFEIEPDGH